MLFLTEVVKSTQRGILTNFVNIVTSKIKTDQTDSPTRTFIRTIRSCNDVKKEKYT